MYKYKCLYTHVQKIYVSTRESNRSISRQPAVFLSRSHFSVFPLSKATGAMQRKETHQGQRRVETHSLPLLKIRYFFYSTNFCFFLTGLLLD